MFEIDRLRCAVALALLAVATSPALSFAGGPLGLRNILRRPLAGTVKSNLPGVADGVLDARGVQLPQQLSLANRASSCSGSAMPVPEQIQSYPAPFHAEPMPTAAPVQYSASRPVEAEARGADLVLEDVKLFEDATLVAGPAYSVRYRNQGVQPSAKFSVAIIASLDGQLPQDAPRVVMEVNGLYHGATQEIVLRLPRCEFKYLIVVVDAAGVVSELDESNNAAVLERGSL
jgi:hypothetical protein